MFAGVYNKIRHGGVKTKSGREALPLFSNISLLLRVLYPSGVFLFCGEDEGIDLLLAVDKVRLCIGVALGKV